jgi:hypothetical protein
MSNLSGPAARKISIVAVLKEIFFLGQQNFAAIARLALPWLALEALCNAWASFGHAADATSIGPLDFLSAFVGFIGAASIAVSWHRQVLLNQDLKLVQQFHVDKTVLIYITTYLLIALVVGIPLGLVIVAVQFLPPIFLPILVVLTILVMIMTVRLSLRLVAIAIGNLELSFQTAFEKTRGNNFAILCIMLTFVIFILVIFFGFQLLSQTATAFNPKLEIPLRVIFAIPIELVVLIANSALYSTLYRFFIEGKELQS